MKEGNIKKQVVNTYDDFIRILKEVRVNRNESIEYQNEGIYIKQNKIIENLIFTDFEIEKDILYGFVFIECDFVNIRFNNTYTTECIFKKCNFRYIKAFKYFDRTVFLECDISESFFYTVHFYSIIFDGSFIFNTNISFSSNKFIIKNSELFSCDISQAATSSLYTNSVHLNDSSIGSCTFRIMKSKNYCFNNCEFSHNHFQYSELKNSVFLNNTRTVYHQYSDIDLSTLNWSEKLSGDILKNIFSVHNPDIQLYLKDCFTEIKYETVFISFSFKNEPFARHLSQQLLLKGVKTWFWPEDASGGKRTKDIMYKGVNDNDRVIFICSEDSLRSEACHYELGEARKKEGKLWKEVLFPIAIDKSVFDPEFVRNIRKYEKKNADEWIANIEWLKEYNILDFSEYCKSEFNTDDFSKAIDSLVNDLRKQIEKEA